MNFVCIQFKLYAIISHKIIYLSLRADIYNHFNIYEIDFMTGTVMKQCYKLKLQHIVVCEYTMHKHKPKRTHSQTGFARSKRNGANRELDCTLVGGN